MSCCMLASVASVAAAAANRLYKTKENGTTMYWIIDQLYDHGGVRHHLAPVVGVAFALPLTVCSR